RRSRTAQVSKESCRSKRRGSARDECASVFLFQSLEKERECPFLALLEPREMSDLSPQSGPKRTLIGSLSPLRRPRRWSVHEGRALPTWTLRPTPRAPSRSQAGA